MYDGLFSQVESITSLLVGLTSRLARAEAEAGAARTEADQQLCRRKQDKLEAQLLEAKSLQARNFIG
jgi:hypothetical protein